MGTTESRQLGSFLDETGRPNKRQAYNNDDDNNNIKESIRLFWQKNAPCHKVSQQDQGCYAAIWTADSLGFMNWYILNSYKYNKANTKRELGTNTMPEVRNFGLFHMLQFDQYSLVLLIPGWLWPWAHKSWYFWLRIGLQPPFIQGESGAAIL